MITRFEKRGKNPTIAAFFMFTFFIKRVVPFAVLVLSICLLFSLSGCKKNNTPPGGGGGGQGTGLSIWYPATVTISTISNPNPTVNTYVYDKDHNLIRYGNDKVYREVSVHGVNRKVVTTDYISRRSYAFSNANSLTTSVSIYDGLPTQVEVVDFDQDRSSGVTTSMVIGPWNLVVDKTTTISTMIKRILKRSRSCRSPAQDFLTSPTISR
ncbi:MAG: hypothetical protein EOP55_17755 [Sphingobacteriales bacterium]|nr:MAG: hypothetical protein EOP55_17755 [Sphingobacteriales bacterium]